MASNILKRAQAYFAMFARLQRQELIANVMRDAIIKCALTALNELDFS